MPELGQPSAGRPARTRRSDPTGFDCSGLVQWAYAHAGITVPRTSQLQYNAGPRRQSGGQLQPGDLLFFGASPTAIHHVGIFIGDGLMVDAPHSGALVRLDRVAGFSPSYVGATAPGNGR